MKQILMLAVLLAVSGFAANLFAPLSGVDTMNPYRKIGSNYVCLSDRFEWVDTYRNKMVEKKSPQQELALDRLRQSEPKKLQWIRVQNTVLEVQPGGDLLLGSARSQILVKHFPQTATVDQALDFHAYVLQSWTHKTGHSTMIVDFGIPYDPWALKRLKDSRTNAPPTNAPHAAPTSPPLR